LSAHWPELWDASAFSVPTPPMQPGSASRESNDGPVGFAARQAGCCSLPRLRGEEQGPLFQSAPRRGGALSGEALSIL
jgi:hypothetical protein